MTAVTITSNDRFEVLRKLRQAHKEDLQFAVVTKGKTIKVDAFWDDELMSFVPQIARENA